MTALTYRQYGWQRWMQWLPASVAGAAVFARVLPIVDRVLMGISGNRLSIPALVTGLPVVIMTTTGARSGAARTTPVIGVPDGEDIVLVASNWGQRRHPAWYTNLNAHPEAVLEFAGRRGRYRAREVTAPDERERLWRRANEVYRGYEKYAARTGGRKIPILVLTPGAD